MTQFRLENKSEFVDEIQLYEDDGVCKSSEFSRLEFSQIEIQCSHSCLALKFQVSSICCHTQPACDISVGGYHSVRTVWVLGASLIRFSWHLFCCLQISRADQVTMLFSDLNKDNFLQMPPLFLQVGRVLPHGLDYIVPGKSPTWKPVPYSYQSSFRKHSWIGLVFNDS